MTLNESLYSDLTDLMVKYSGMEMTTGEAVGLLFMKAIELSTPKQEEEE